MKRLWNFLASCPFFAEKEESNDLKYSRHHHWTSCGTSVVARSFSSQMVRTEKATRAKATAHGDSYTREHSFSPCPSFHRFLFALDHHHFIIHTLKTLFTLRGGNVLMKPFSSQKFDLLGFILGIFLFLTLVGQGLLSTFLTSKSIPFLVFQAIYICVMGLNFLYGGIKKLHQRKEQHEQAHWYTQPGILVALGAFFLLPFWALEIVVGTARVNTFPPVIEIALFVPTGVCYLASGFFFFRRLIFRL